MSGFKQSKNLKNSAAFRLKGTKQSLKNSTALTSSGIPSLDQLIGGGMAVGTVALIEEDAGRVYSRLMVKYFCAEGIVSEHSTAVISADASPDDFMKELPDSIDVGSQCKESDDRLSDDPMKIAWRYQNMSIDKPKSSSSTLGNHFDLTKTMDTTAYLDSPRCHRLHCFPRTSVANATCQSTCDEVIKFLRDVIPQGHSYNESQGARRSVLRICVLSLGSPLWGRQSDSGIELAQFLCQLRALVKNSLTVAMVTVPSQLFEDSSLLQRLRHLSDYTFSLESFAGSEKATNPAYKEYHGIFTLGQLPLVNSLEPVDRPVTTDLAFKVTRKKFVIERLHLPPALSETVSRSNQAEPIFGCSSTAPGGKFDF